MLPNFAQPFDNRTDADIPLSFVSLLRWCEERNVAPEPLPDSDEAKWLRSEFIAHVERLGGIADAATFQSEGWADEPYRSVRGRAKQLCRRLAVGHGEVPRACLDPQPCYWPLKPLKTDRDLLSWLCERLEQLDSGIEVEQLKHRCVAMIEAMRIAHGWLEQRRIFNAPRCVVTEVELNEVFTNKFNGLGWSNSLPPYTVVEALVRDLVNQIRQSFLDLLSWLQDRVGTEMEPDSDSKTVTPHTGQDPTRIPTRRQLDRMHGAALVCFRNFDVARLDILCLVASEKHYEGQPVSLERLEETLPNLKDALTQFDERWTADVADWFCLHHPDYQARFGEQLTATRYARDCCANAVIAVQMALNDIAGGLYRAREFLRAERCAITEANIDDEWRHACRELAAVTGTVDQQAEASSEPPKPVERQPRTLAGDEGSNGKQTIEAEYVFRLDGDGYFIKGCINGCRESGHFAAKGARGLDVLFRLVQTPGVPVPMLKLVAGAGVERAKGDGQSRQPVADALTLKDIRAEGRQLLADIEAAESEMERTELQEKLSNLEATTKGMMGIKGKPRDLNNPNDGFRSTIHKQLNRVYDKLRKRMPQLVEHFGLSCGASGGDGFVYAPAGLNITWDTDAE